MRHLAIAAASSAAIVAYTYGDALPFDGESQRHEPTANQTITNQTTTHPVTPLRADTPVRKAGTPASVQLAAASPGAGPLEDDRMPCGSAMVDAGQTPAKTDGTPSVAKQDSDPLPEGEPMRLTGVCGNETIQAVDLRGLSGDEPGGTADEIQLADNRFPSADIPKAKRRTHAMGPAEETFDLLRPGASPPASSSVKTNSDYRP